MQKFAVGFALLLTLPLTGMAEEKASTTEAAPTTAESATPVAAASEGAKTSEAATPAAKPVSTNPGYIPYNPASAK